MKIAKLAVLNTAFLHLKGPDDVALLGLEMLDTLLGQKERA